MTTPRLRSRFLHEPRTEQEVVCLFGALLDHLDFPLEIEQVQTAFPDCTVRRLDTGERLRLEFELYGSHFRTHRHPHTGCELLVCWRDDLGNWPSNIKVFELADILARERPDLIASIDQRDPHSPWNESAFFERALQDGASTRDLALTQLIITTARARGLGPQWLRGPEAVFAVGDTVQFFKVWSTGQLGFPFSRLGAGERFPDLVVQLVRALPSLSVGPSDVNSKGKGGLLSDLFQSDDQVRELFAVWDWFRGRGAT